jgi:CheY-like chemotaxis protein
MSHELRTPLTGILGLSEALQYNTYGTLTEKQNKVLRSIEESGRHLLDLINDILDLSKIEAGLFELNIDLFSLSDVCQASLQLTKGLAQKKNQNVRFSMEPPAIQLYGDAKRLKQMLVNLLSNAIKFTPESGALGLEVKADQNEKVVKLTVWDKGIGIASENLEVLFQPFIQLESSLSRQYEATGLGLSLVRRMAELQGGSVQVESVLGEGSKFTIQLPWMPEITQPISTEKQGSLSIIKKALIIEDHQIDTGQITRYLQIMGIETVTYKIDQNVIEICNNEKPDLILLDLQSTDESGFDVLVDLKQNFNTQYTPFIFCCVEENRTQAMNLGATAFLPQPLAFIEFRDVIHKAATTLEQNATDKSISAPTQATVLIVDDNEVVQQTIADFLGTLNFRVVSVRSGVELLSMVADLHPDIILMDIQMPGMDGLEATRHIRTHPDPLVSQVPIIAVTALAMYGDRDRCLAAGANEYLSKPIGLRQLVGTIRDQLKDK